MAAQLLLASSRDVAPETRQLILRLIVPEARESRSGKLVLGAGTSLRRFVSSRRSAQRLRLWPSHQKRAVKPRLWPWGGKAHYTLRRLAAYCFTISRVAPPTVATKWLFVHRVGILDFRLGNSCRSSRDDRPLICLTSL